MNEDILLAGIWHLRSRIGSTMSGRVHEGNLASLVSPLSPLLRTTGPFTNRSVVCTCAISSWDCCGREEYVTGNLFGTESDWGRKKIPIVYPAVTTYPMGDKFLLELGNWCAEVIDLPRHLQDLLENGERRCCSVRKGRQRRRRRPIQRTEFKSELRCFMVTISRIEER